MKKYIIGALVFAFVVFVIFCVVTLILANQHDVTFAQEIVSWFDKSKDVVVKTTDTTARVLIRN